MRFFLFFGNFPHKRKQETAHLWYSLLLFFAYFSFYFVRTFFLALNLV